MKIMRGSVGGSSNGTSNAGGGAPNAEVIFTVLKKLEHFLVKVFMSVFERLQSVLIRLQGASRTISPTCRPPTLPLPE